MNKAMKTAKREAFMAMVEHAGVPSTTVLASSEPFDDIQIGHGALSLEEVVERYIVCTCPTVILLDAPPRDPCPKHEGFWYEGTFYRRCGDSDVTGPYYVGGAGGGA